MITSGGLNGNEHAGKQNCVHIRIWIYLYIHGACIPIYRSMVHTVVQELGKLYI